MKILLYSHHVGQIHGSTNSFERSDSDLESNFSIKGQSVEYRLVILDAAKALTSQPPLRQKTKIIGALLLLLLLLLLPPPLYFSIADSKLRVGIWPHNRPQGFQV